MDRRNPSDLTHSSLLPEQLVDEVHDAQAALAVAEHYISSSSQKTTSYAMHQFYATHEALHEARKTIDRVIEMLRAEAARSLRDSA
jgi:transcriptional regulator GlxA family with amidase domain